ncbi:MAG: hypothetical protein V1772_05260 [Chloroflexota bacterium]
MHIRPGHLCLALLTVGALATGCRASTPTPAGGATRALVPGATAIGVQEPQPPAPISANTLKGYRQTVMFTEKVAGAEPTRWTMTIEYDGATRAWRHIMSGADSDGNDLSWESVRIGDVTYMRTGDEWITIESAQSNDWPAAFGIEQPESLMVGGGCAHAGKETVNGLAATRYRCEQSRFVERMALAGAEGTITKADVELWVSDKLNIVVRSVMAWEGTTPTGQGLASRYESVLSDVDKPIAISKPEGAPEAGVAEDIPLPQGITDRMAMPNMVSFKMAQSAQQLADYYQLEMAQRGWAPDAQGTMAPDMLAFRKGDRTATVILSQEGATTAVMITTQ